MYYDCARLNYCLLLNSTAYYSHLMLKYDKICDIKGLRYEGRTLKLENLRIGDSIHIKREKSNHYNYNNFSVIDENEDNLGNLPAELCNVIAPLYDAGYLTIEKSTVSFIEKIGERSRYAMQGILFIEMIMRIH